MKAFLMHKDHDFDLQRKFPAGEQALTQDLELNTLFDAMAKGDKFLFEVAKKAVLASLHDLDAIAYRQAILKDSLKNSSVIRSMYAIAVEAIENEKKHYLGLFGSKYPAWILRRSADVLQMFMGMLRKLWTIADEHAGRFESEGFTAFFSMLKQELADEFFATVQEHLRELKFPNGVLLSAQLAKGNKGSNYILRKPVETKQCWWRRLFAKKRSEYTIQIHERDESGARALSELSDRGINLVANALAQSVDHILSFFTMLRAELAFYVGCLNLHEQLAQKGAPLSFPLPVSLDKRSASFQGLYDVCLALTMGQRVVGNDARADNKALVIITGANQGGKSTFLRSVGLAQLMMQCGMFVPAEFFCANLCNGLYTHFKREEDNAMKSGKLDEELGRMSEIVDNLTANSMVLFNESFAATNEREGSEIARQIVSALVEKKIKVFYVTHLYDFARSLYDQKLENAIFLRAERQSDGGRTFKIIEGEPLQTSFGEDLYRQVTSARYEKL